VYANDIHGLYVLQLLEFHWNTTLYWHNVAWMMDISKNIYHMSSGSMEIITCHLSQGW